MRKLLLFVIICTLCAFIATAASSDMSVSYYIEYGKALVDTEIEFDEPTSITFAAVLPDDARAITMSVDGEQVDPLLEENILSYELSEAKTVNYKYISAAFLDSNEFIANIKAPVDAQLFVVKVSLPEKAVLATAIDDSTVPSVFPKPSSLETDGRVIDVIWQMDGVSAEKEYPIMVRYAFSGRYSWIPWFILIAAIVGVVVYLIISGFRPKKTIKIKNMEEIEEVKYPSEKKTEHKTDDISKHLKEGEEQVVSILKSREGQCEQGTLRVITGFSKAKLSGLLQELEDRKIVYKEKRGKKNLVFFKG